jgi:autotransporter-associated beta strand protein
MKSKSQFVASGVGATWLPAARSLAMTALLALAATASAQTNGTWTGADGATWDTSATNWSGVSGTPWASPGTTANATFNATSGSASVSGTVFANTITYSPVGGNFSIANGTITLAGTNSTINNYDPTGTLTIASTVVGNAGLISRGAGTLVLSGNNTYTGNTTIKGGPLVLDYSGLSNTADPLSTGAVTLDMGTLTLKGKSSGSTSETISTLNMGANLGTANTLRLDSNGGSGIALTVSNLSMNTAPTGNSQNINLIDLSSSASNSITVSALGATAKVFNGVLMHTPDSGTSGRANLVVRDSSGYGFATLSGAISGTIGRLSTGTTLDATNSSNATNYRLTNAGTLTRTATLDYSTITLDSTAGAVTLAMGTNNLAPSSTGSGRGILITGPNDVSITGTGRLEGAAAAWFHNYSTGTFTYGLSTAASNGASLMFGGSGLTVWTGTSNKTSSSDSLYIEGGIFRPTTAQNWTTGFGVVLAACRT